MLHISCFKINQYTYESLSNLPVDPGVCWVHIHAEVCYRQIWRLCHRSLSPLDQTPRKSLILTHCNISQLKVTSTSVSVTNVSDVTTPQERQDVTKLDTTDVNVTPSASLAPDQRYICCTDVSHEFADKPHGSSHPVVRALRSSRDFFVSNHRVAAVALRKEAAAKYAQNISAPRARSTKITPSETFQGVPCVPHPPTAYRIRPKLRLVSASSCRLEPARVFARSASPVYN